MSESTEVLQARNDTSSPILPGAEAPLTPLAAALETEVQSLVPHRGMRSVAHFTDAAEELSALVNGVAAFDQGARVRIRVTGTDRVRWLNGMVTNSVKALETGAHQYTFVLNAQGRIQGDATVFALEGELLLETDQAQVGALLAHLEHFIIMDDVEITSLGSTAGTTLGLAGVGASALLGTLGLPVPGEGEFALLASGEGGGMLGVVGEYSPGPRRFSLWVAEGEVLGVWQSLLQAGAVAAGVSAVESLRILEGTPLYGAEMTNKTLAQETGQMRALNFNKGCYLGQEIVERIRSRANVHRGLRQFALDGGEALAGTPVTYGGVAAGELTSLATVSLAGQVGQVALGMVRLEALEHSGTLEYADGLARALAASPLVPWTAVES